MPIAGFTFTKILAEKKAQASGEIKINTNKIIAESLFLADNSLYNTQSTETSLYFESWGEGELRALTYHSAGLQNISYSTNGTIKKFDIKKINEPVYINLSEGNYRIAFPENDIIVSTPGYLAFEEKNYFEPFKQRVIKVINDLDWIKSNVDYLILDYQTPIKEENGWLVSETEFSIKNDNLFIKDNKLNMVFSLPHLAKEEGFNYPIPIDWIKIKVFKEGAIK